ncbi:MAG TPA: PQQ-dependent sugar dehydrogenase [Patescibacteria group bacterium]|nr:PQQ-dependent sugar dehydrogenase [Patescibacteria group bacterium]
MTGRIPNLARALILGSLFATVISGQSAFADDPVASVRSPSADATVPRPAATRVGSRVDLTGARQALAATVATYTPGAIDLALSSVVGGLRSPLFVTNAGDGSGRLFVVEKAGKIRIVSGGVVTGTFLDIRAKVSKVGERGLLGLAFHPDYPTTGTFYVYYTDLKGRIVLAAYHRSTGDPDKADPVGSVLLRISKPFSNHNGGMLAFGPDGYLYMGTGDGGSGGDPGNRAQNLKSLLGKLLRIDINGRTSARPYRIPSSNPYVGKVGYDQIWARGLRNPWRFSFDSLTGDLWIGDVGQDRWEEIDRSQAAGGGGRAKNYGWRVMEGKVCYHPSSHCIKSGKKLPLAVYSHAKGCSVTGGYVYRGTEFPDLAGGYLFADFCSGRIWSVAAAGAAAQTPHLLHISNKSISSFGEGEDGALYVTDLAKGGLYKLVDTTP